MSIENNQILDYNIIYNQNLDYQKEVNNMSSYIVLAVFWCGFFILLHKVIEPTRSEPPARYEPDSDLLLTLQRIDEMKVTAERIRQLENILTDIDLIGENAEKGIILTVPSISGSQTEYSFISSQADTTGFKTAAQSELDRLKRTLQHQIDSLQQQRKRNESNNNSRKGE